MSKVFILGDRSFKNKTQARKFIADYLRTHTHVDEDDKGWIYDLLSRHPRFEEKVGSIQAVYIKNVLGHNCFFVETEYGNITDISYIKCLMGENKVQLAKAAFRYAIHEQIKDYKNKMFKGKEFLVCPVSGKALYNNSDTHIDHHYEKLPFDKIVRLFCLDNDIDLSSIDMVSCGIYKKFADPNIEERFRQYHLQHAILRAVHRSANLSAPRHEEYKVDEPKNVN